MAEQYMPLEDCSGCGVLGGEIPQLRPPAFSDDSKYTTFSYTYYPDSSVLVMQSQIPDLTHKIFRISKESLAYYLPKNRYLGGSEISAAVTPNISTRFYAIQATIDFSKAKGDLQAVLMAHGGCFGGHSFYIYQGKLCYVYNWLGQQQKITCDLSRLSGEMTLKVEFTKTKIIAPSDEKLDDSTIDKMKLYINNIEQNVDIIRTFLNHTPNFLTQYKHEIPDEFQGAKLRRIIVTITNDITAINID
ncbi:MAG: hypothetical protein VKL41_11430 [Snowella sp.]|nr:hypothetical protein [Snowella sp.]